MAAKKQASRFRSFRITIFEDDTNNLDTIDQRLRAGPLKEERCLAFQKEKCPETGKLHLQGFLQTETPISFEGARKLFPGGSIWVKQADNPQGALEYANKDDTRVEGYEPFKRGDIKVQGKRTDIHAACEQVREVGYVKGFLSMPESFVKYGRGLREYATLLQEQNTPEMRPVQVEVFWGDAGSGKSHFCANMYPGDSYRLPLPRGKSGLWFDGYQGEKVLILEDFNAWLQYKELLRICDGLKERWQIKGGFIMANWELVLITANEPPNTWYRDYKERDGRSIPQDIWDQRNQPGEAGYKPSALQRRINRIVSCQGMFPNSVWTQTFPLINGEEVVVVTEEEIALAHEGQELQHEMASEDIDAMLSFNPFGPDDYDWADEHGIPFPQ